MPRRSAPIGRLALVRMAQGQRDLPFPSPAEAWNLEAPTPNEQFDALLYLRTVALATMR